MPSRIEATRAKAALCATGRLTPLRLFSTLPFVRQIGRRKVQTCAMWISRQQPDSFRLGDHPRERFPIGYLGDPLLTLIS